MSVTETASYNLVLDENERSWLAQILREMLTETHGEMRRTEGAAFREKVHEEELVLRTLLDKVRALKT